MSMTQTAERAILEQTRRGLRTLLAVPAARAAGLAKASARNPSLLDVKASAVAENPQYFRKSRRVIVDIIFLR